MERVVPLFVGKQAGMTTRKAAPDPGRAAANARSTVLDDAHTDASARRARLGRRVGVCGLVVLVGLSLSGVLGQKTSVVSAAAGGYTLTVRYPSVIRPGVDVRWDVSVKNTHGFGKSLRLSFPRHYFDIFDINSMRPDPDSVTSDGDQFIYTWDSPPGTAFTVAFDATVEFGEHLGLDGATSVLQNNLPVVTARYHSREVP